MQPRDASKIKESILEFLNSKGPSLPVHVAQGIGMSPLFTSAFLSELFSEKKLRMSNLRVGSSPVYFLENQEADLEKFANYLKSKEKDAFLRIKERQILKDSEQEPAIRVALRAIKDFAVPFEKNGELYWKYFVAQEQEAIKEIEEVMKFKEEVETPKEEKEPKVEEPEATKKTAEHKKKEKKKPAKKIEKAKKGNEKFLSRVKEFLSKENIEIMGVESFSKDGIVLKVKTREGEKAFIAYNKKKIGEKDFVSANKKAEELGLKYIILSLGEMPKKMKEMIEAIKNLSGIEKIE